MKTAKDQRHKDGDKRPFWALSLPAYLGGLETKNVRNKRKNIDGRMTLLIFLSRLQIENYMTAFSIQPIKTVLSHLRVAVVKFQYPCVNGLITFLLF